MEWLGTYSDALVAISALLTAMATVAIAVLTSGTIALYRLERGRDKALRGRLAAQLWRLQNHFRTTADLILTIEKTDPLLGGTGRDIVRFIATENASRARQLEALLEQAGSAPMELVARLDASFLMLRGTEAITDHILKSTGGNVALVEPRETLRTELLAVSRLLREAYDHLPEEDRKWAGGSDTYDKVLAAVLQPFSTRAVKP